MQSASKKLLLVLILALTLCGCSVLENNEKSPNDKYQDMIELIRTYDVFESSSDYFEISSEKVKDSDGGYRFYITIDEPHVAMYDVEAIAIELEEDYSNKMAANVGIFEESEYSLIPNQSNPNKGYYAGIVISGTTENENASLYILVQWKSKDKLTTLRQYLLLNI